MHYFKYFKGFEETQLDLFKPLTILIGPNGSGKSNAVEGVEMLSFIAQGSPIYEITDVGRGGKLEVRGGLQACPRYGQSVFSLVNASIPFEGKSKPFSRYGQSVFSLGFNASIPFEGKSKPFFYSISIWGESEPRIVGESLTFLDKTDIFHTIGQPECLSSGDIKVQFNNFAKGGRKPVVSVSNSRSILSQYKEFTWKKNKKYDLCVAIVNSIMSYLRSAFVFDPNPKLMRGYERIGNTVLSRDGANLSAVLYSLDQGKEEEKQTLRRLFDGIRQLPEEPCDAFMFFKTPLNDVIFGLQTADGRFPDARLLSDGTLRSLAVLTAIETAAPRSRVIIEEFDNGLHPSRVHILTEAIASCCKRKNLNVLVTTHNPATLNALQEEQLDGVVLCVWDKEQKAFKFVRLSEVPRYDELLEQGRLGDLVTRRVVEQYLAPKFEETRKEKALNWLRSLS